MTSQATTGHTPGVWEVRDRTRLERDCHAVEGQTPESNGGKVIGLCYGPDAAANARLTAAAPELLAQADQGLQSLERELACILESVCLLNDNLEPRRDTAEAAFLPDIEELERQIAASKLVIAKARGEQ